MEDTRIYGRYMLVAIPEKGKPFKVSEVATLCQAQDERGEWQEHYGCDVVFFDLDDPEDWESLRRTAKRRFAEV